MYASDMMGDHSIEHCQSLLLLSVMMVRLYCPCSCRDCIELTEARIIVIEQKQPGLCWEVQSRRAPLSLIFVSVRNADMVQMAQNLGMSRLGSEQQAEDGKPLATWTGRWESLVQREVGRRIWWNLVSLEWALAPSYSFCTA